MMGGQLDALTAHWRESLDAYDLKSRPCFNFPGAEQNVQEAYREGATLRAALGYPWGCQFFIYFGKGPYLLGRKWLLLLCTFDKMERG